MTSSDASTLPCSAVSPCGAERQPDCLSVQSPLQQLRAVRPLGPDRTLTEIWHFRLKGAPEAIYRRSLAYYYHVNSPSTMVNADDLHNFWACEEGLKLNLEGVNLDDKANAFKVELNFNL